MTTKNLNALFQPKSIALFGASEREGSVGKTLTDNLYQEGYQGDIWLINPKHKKVHNQRCYKDLKECPGTPELAIIATPPKHVPKIIKDLGKRGTKAAVIITAGLREKKITQKMLDAAQPYSMRILGPNSMGIMLPSINLNASFAHTSPIPGDLAFLSQSGAIISSVLDWATGKGIGFSCMMSVGNMTDVDLGDLIDYLSQDKKTRAILMYLEHVTDAKKFISAARAAARIKPLVAIKSGRFTESAQAAHSHTGALSGSDAIYDAVFHRAGVLRVYDLEELFVAVETLSYLKQASGERLGIITNGGGIGVLAVDSLIELNGRLASLSPSTIKQLDKTLPTGWSQANPIDLLGDATPERYQKAIEAALEDPNIDSLLVMNCPTALASNIEAAQRTVETIKHYYQHEQESPKILLTAWLGDETARQARKVFSKHGYPTYDSPRNAIQGLSYLTRHTKNLKTLMFTPPSVSQEFDTKPQAARAIIQSIFKAKRTLANEYESKEILKAYNIPVVPTEFAKTPEDVAFYARLLLQQSEALVVKLLSKDISHKSDAQAVVLNLTSPEKAQEAAQKMLDHLKQKGKVQIEGFSVQVMVDTPNAYETIIGMHVDDVFGPVMMFGAGGTAVEVIQDTAIELPPLDLNLALDLIHETRISKLLQGYRNKPGVDFNALALTLVKVSQMIIDLPELQELDINPLYVDHKGVLALDARMRLKPSESKPGKSNPNLAIHPYPKEWETCINLSPGPKILIRPIRPEDEQLYPLFMDKTSGADIRLRLFSSMKKLSRSHIAKLTQIDYAREMAFIALDIKTQEMLGVVRLHINSSGDQAEYGVITRSDVKDQGIGHALMTHMIRYAKEEAIEEVWGLVLADNKNMLGLCKRLKFTKEADKENPGLVKVRLDLKKY